jgi:Uma2 family endonuclease
MYARRGVREVWLVDLARDRVEIHVEPGPDGYRRVEVRERGDRLIPGAFGDLSLAVNELLG